MMWASGQKNIGPLWLSVTRKNAGWEFAVMRGGSHWPVVAGMGYATPEEAQEAALKAAAAKFAEWLGECGDALVDYA